MRHPRRVLLAAVAVGLLVGGYAAWKLDPLGGPGKPTLRVYCGGSMRRPMEELIGRFEQRNDVRIDTVYNGCGQLVAQMQAGAGGDVYYSCDVHFMDLARQAGAVDESYPIANVTHFRPVIMVAKGNPKSIGALDDLAREGMRVGLGAEKHGAVGRSGWMLVRASAKSEAIQANVKTVAPTADFLATQLVTGHLDAVIVWDAVAVNYADKSDIVRISEALTDQPIAMMKNSPSPDLAGRFIEFIRSD